MASTKSPFKLGAAAREYERAGTLKNVPPAVAPEPSKTEEKPATPPETA